MGRLTSGLAHELRNPLQNVVGLTSELVERSRGSLRQHPEFVDFPEYLRRPIARENEPLRSWIDFSITFVSAHRPSTLSTCAGS